MRLLLSAIMLCAACSSTGLLTLSATPDPLPGDGVTPGTVVAKLTQGGSPADGMVHFVTTVGSFKEAPSGTPGIADIQATGGTATANLIAPRQGWGQVSITATASLDGKHLSAASTMQLVPAGGPANTLSFKCLHQNIGGLVHGRQDTLHLLCVATAFINNKAIPNASVQTLSEAGSLDWAHDDNGVQQFVYSVRPDDPPPKDVGPFDGSGHEQAVCPAGCVAAPFDFSQCPGEPCWTDPTGLTHNPRDGIATLIAAVPGVKSFDDQGEPFVDSNDNGVWDPGEPYIDYNGNGKWDPPAGKEVKDRLIWKTYRVIWSGEAAVTPSGSTRNTHDIFMTKSGADLSLTLFDRNFNALAADGPSASDGISWSATCAGDGQITMTIPTALNQTDPGVLFTDDSGKISAPGLRTTWTRGTVYSNRTSFTGAPKQECTIAAGPQRSYDPGAPEIPSGGGAANPDNPIAAAFPFP